MNINNYKGLYKVYLNDSFIGTFGTINSIDHSKYIKSSNVMLPSVLLKEKDNLLNLEIYTQKGVKEESINIVNNNVAPVNFLIKKLSQDTLPFSFVICAILILVIFIVYSDKKIENIFFIWSVVTFIIYFIVSGFEGLSFIKYKFFHVTFPISIIAWALLVINFAAEKKVWNLKKTLITSTLIVYIILFLSFLHRVNILLAESPITIKLLTIGLNALFLFLIITKYNKNDRILKYAVSIALTFNIISFATRFFLNNMFFILEEISIIIILSSYIFRLINGYKENIHKSDLYNNKLNDAVNKFKQEVSKKENSIIELKVQNDEILREKALFFTSLSRNLRTPLNSIIGYSENLYYTNDIKEVHPLVTEIILESDKIFQAINNVMDFSSRKFTNDDLQLKDFRMKEIFENSVHDSSLITAYRKNIKYLSENHSDKVLINGNPTIYKQILTSVLHYIISLKPEDINYTISNSGITENYMDLIVEFKAEGLKRDELSIIETSNNNKEILSKYVTLYNIDYTQEESDNTILMRFKFQCGVSKSTKSETQTNLPLDQVLYKNLTVLVVEDYLPNLNIVKLHLNKMGCDVFTATTGDEAIAIFKREDIDVILMDIKMPVMDGWEATELIRSTKKGLNTLIIGLTASSLDLDIRHCFESGMDDVQVKPIRKNQLFNKLNNFEKYKPEIFPSPASLRADYGISKVETETLFIYSIKQIEKQLEVIEILISAKDDSGMEKEMPAIIHAALTINAFYYTRLLRNLHDAYKNEDKERQNSLMIKLQEVIKEVKTNNATLFRN